MWVAIEKTCLCCSKTIRGRSDKKFCDDACRNSYNNQHRPISADTVKRINAVLIKNRKILIGLIGESDRRKVSREQLCLHGFIFNYYTHSYTNKKGSVYYFCYDYGWLELNESILVVRSAFN